MRKLIYLLMLVLIISMVDAQTTVKGVVLDSLDNLVDGAELKADCLMDERFVTDKFGSFMIEGLPSGNCRIYATFADGVGFEDIVIEEKTLDLEIKLDKTIVKFSERSNYNVLLFVLGIVILILILLYFKLLRKERKIERKVKEEEKEIKRSEHKRARDILKTSNAKERKIIEFLLDNNHISSQSKIRHNTGITRTSLARCLKGLEAKNIVSLERIGKLVKVKLTEWFLEK